MLSTYNNGSVCALPLPLGYRIKVTEACPFIKLFFISLIHANIRLRFYHNNVINCKAGSTVFIDKYFYSTKSCKSGIDIINEK